MAEFGCTMSSANPSNPSKPPQSRNPSQAVPGTSPLQRDSGTLLTTDQVRQSPSPSTSLRDERAGASTIPAQNTPYAHSIEIDDDGVRPFGTTGTTSSTRDFANTLIEGGFDEPSQHGIGAHTKLLESYDHGPGCGSKSCNHGTFSPRPMTHNSVRSWDSRLSFGGRYGEDIGDGDGGGSSNTRGIFGDAIVNGLFGAGNKGKKMSTTQWLAKTHGVKNPRRMYVEISFNFVVAFFLGDSR